MTLVKVYDSLNVGAIPSDATVLLGYVDGELPLVARNYELMRERFVSERIITVTTTGNSRAMMCDCEKYDLSPAMVRQWIDRGLYIGPKPWVYSSKSRYGAVLDATAGGSPWWWWAADWTGVPHIVPGSSATQYANPATSGGDFDVSVALPEALDALFPPPIPPTTRKASDMILINNGTTQYVLFGDGTKIPVDDPADLSALASVMPGSVTLSAGQCDSFPTK